MGNIFDNRRDYRPVYLVCIRTNHGNLTLLPHWSKQAPEIPLLSIIYIYIFVWHFLDNCVPVDGYGSVTGDSSGLDLRLTLGSCSTVYSSSSSSFSRIFAAKREDGVSLLRAIVRKPPCFVGHRKRSAERKRNEYYYSQTCSNRR